MLATQANAYDKNTVEPSLTDTSCNWFNSPIVKILWSLKDFKFQSGSFSFQAICIKIYHKRYIQAILKVWQLLYRTPSIYKLPWWKQGFFPSSYACFMISFTGNFFFCRSSQIKSSDILTPFFDFCYSGLPEGVPVDKETWQWQVSGHLKHQSWVPQSYARSLSQVWCPNR